MQTFASIAELKAFKGKVTEPSPWHEVTQSQIDLFADATGARREPSHACVPFFTLSLLPKLTAKIFQYENVKVRVNYGLNSVRFTGAVSIGSKIRIKAALQGVNQEPDGGAKVRWSVIFEIAGTFETVCTAETLTKLYF